MQTVTIDLKKLPEVADFLADKQPGDEVYLCGTIKSLDDQTCVVTVSEIEDRASETENEPGGNEGSAADDERNPKGSAMDQAGASPDALRDISPGEKASY